MTTAVKTGAVFGGPSAEYRYSLLRQWDEGDVLVWMMLNPSTADATEDDPTIRRCIGFARQWSFGGIEVVNLFAYRATDPKELLRAHKQGIDVVGPDNDMWIRDARQRSPIVVAAWGCNGGLLQRDRQVTKLLAELAWWTICLGKTKQGCPRHPLYAPYHARALDYP